MFWAMGTVVIGVGGTTIRSLVRRTALTGSMSYRIRDVNPCAPRFSNRAGPATGKGMLVSVNGSTVNVTRPVKGIVGSGNALVTRMTWHLPPPSLTIATAQYGAAAVGNGTLNPFGLCTTIVGAPGAAFDVKSTGHNTCDAPVV